MLVVSTDTEDLRRSEDERETAGFNHRSGYNNKYETSQHFQHREEPHRGKPRNFFGHRPTCSLSKFVEWQQGGVAEMANIGGIYGGPYPQTILANG